MEYGESLFARVWHNRFSGKFLFFRFRIDPIPGVSNHRGWFGNWYKTPRNINEKRQWFASEGYGRLKRSPLNLPDPRDDYQRSDLKTRRSWKSRKIKKQWMKKI